MRNQRAIAAAGLAAAALAVSACGVGPAAAGYSSGMSASQLPAQAAGQTSGMGTTSIVLSLRTETGSAGTVLASTGGRTLYYYGGDQPGSGKSVCTGSCATAWPPLVTPVAAPAGIRLYGPIGSITRANGVRQVTIDGYPVYTYSGDTGPGQANGNGVAGEWHLIKFRAAAASATAAGRDGLMESRHTSLGTVLANPHGMTVYYYGADKRGSGVSACTGSCAQAWPPVTAPVRIPAGMKLSGAVGFIVRPGGVHQVTINGYPIYRYAGDKAPGETTGSDVGGVWHVITLAASPSASTAPSPSPSTSSTSASSGSGW
jgi:predicted lipoprotein with Yx(FWY)xxD motif